MLHIIHQIDNKSDVLALNRLSADFDPTNQYFVSGSGNNLWKIWDAQSGNPILTKSSSGALCILPLTNYTRNKILWLKKVNFEAERLEKARIIAIGGKKSIFVWMLEPELEHIPEPK